MNVTIPIIEAKLVTPKTGETLGQEVRRMDKYLRENIKDLIEKFPTVGELLEEYDIGCVPCSVGTCQVIDIMDIHNLSPEKESELMSRIARLIYPHGQVKLPEIKRKKEDRSRELKYSPPMKRLVDEHVFIKRWAELIPEVIRKFDFESEQDRQMVFEGIDFIRSYADRYHHAKEEDILFSYFDEGLDIIKAMYEDHENARGHVRALLTSLEVNDKIGIAVHLQAYSDILMEHIKKEDEILYPWMDRNLTTTQVGELFAKFNEVAVEFGNSPKGHESFVKRLEERLKE